MSAKASRSLRTALVVVLILAALYIAYRYTLHRMVEAKLDEMRHQGYPVTLAELDKWYPQPLPGENAAEIYLQAFKLFSPEQASDTNLPIVGVAKLPPRVEPMTNEMKRAIADYLAKNADALRLLHQAAAMSYCRYESGSQVGSMAHSSEIRHAVRLLYLEAILHAENQESAKSADSIASVMGVAESFADEPRIIPLLLRGGCDGLVLGAFEQSLNRVAFTSQQLALLTARFAKADDPESTARALASEWASTEQLFATSVSERLTALTSFPPSADRVRLDSLFLYEYGGVKEFDHLRSIELIGKYVTAAKQPLPERLKTAQTIKQQAEQSADVLVNSRNHLSFLSDVIARDAERIAYIRLLLAALGVEKYRLVNGLLPEKISDLAPAEVPVDPFDGQPLRYKKLAKGYVVYSVGEDGVDNGGTEGFCPGTDITFTVER
ncbi:MAG: hypothetical protein ACLPT4_12775 [Verrucomicrobiia bacterium]